jgi:hypothetical protein
MSIEKTMSDPQQANAVAGDAFIALSRSPYRDKRSCEVRKEKGIAKDLLEENGTVPTRSNTQRLRGVDTIP